MIELRWIKRLGWGDHTHVDSDNCSHQVKAYGVHSVLQYRQRMNPDELGLHPPIWGDWQDVPTVTEDET